MSRPILLIFLLIILVITSQFEWRQQVQQQRQRQKQQLIVDTNVVSSSSDLVSAKHTNQERIKEKIILSQERHIQRLNELVQTLREQLQKCTKNNNSSDASIPLLENVIEVKIQD